MNESRAGRQYVIATWFALLIVVAGIFPWSAAAQNGTPADDPVIVETEPATEEPTTAPEAAGAPATEPSDPSGGDADEPRTRPARLLLEEDATPVAPSVTSINLTCTVQGATINGALTTSDPGAAAVIALQLTTTDEPAIPASNDIVVNVTPGTTSYAFEVVLEAGEFEASTTKKVVVKGPEGAPVSDEIAIAADGTATVCVPETAGRPAPTETATSTATATATTQQGTVTNTGGANLRCRAAANTSSQILALLPANSTVQVRGAAVNGWMPVTCGGQEGWVSGDYLTVSTVPAEPTATATATTTPTQAPGNGTIATVVNTGGANLRCRTAPDTQSSIVTLLPAGARVATRGAASGGWVPVLCGGMNGFVSADYVKLGSGTVPPTSTATSTPATATPTTTPGNGTVAYVTGTGGAGLRCRTSPVNGSVITLVSENAKLSVTSQANGWGQVSCGGQTGWVSLSYVLFAVNPGSGDGAIRIDINLSTQYMIVYQGNNVLSRTYVSTGRRGFDTPPGTFYINRKVKVKDMSGVLGGEYYHVRDVPDVMYFTNRGHAIHGAYWHNNFGYVMSHGCVNLPLGFATWLYSITPIGTKVTIHY